MEVSFVEKKSCGVNCCENKCVALSAMEAEFVSAPLNDGYLEGRNIHIKGLCIRDELLAMHG